ncbi:MAG: hypothetical protein AAFR51_15160 [Pseudomonadota bacterium]
MRLALLMFGTLCLSQVVSAAYACTCPPLASAAEQAEEFDMIFIGSPRESINVSPPIEWKPGDPPPPPRADRYETMFDIERVLKGENVSAVKISHSEPNPLSCGIMYTDDAPRLILASGSQETGYSTWFCSIPQFSVEAFDEALKPAAD